MERAKNYEVAAARRVGQLDMRAVVIVQFYFNKTMSAQNALLFEFLEQIRSKNHLVTGSSQPLSYKHVQGQALIRLDAFAVKKLADGSRGVMQQLAYRLDDFTDDAALVVDFEKTALNEPRQQFGEAVFEKSIVFVDYYCFMPAILAYEYPPVDRPVVLYDRPAGPIAVGRLFVAAFVVVRGLFERVSLNGFRSFNGKFILRVVVKRGPDHPQRRRPLLLHRSPCLARPRGRIFGAFFLPSDVSSGRKCIHVK